MICCWVFMFVPLSKFFIITAVNPLGKLFNISAVKSQQLVSEPYLDLEG